MSVRDCELCCFLKKSSAARHVRSHAVPPLRDAVVPSCSLSTSRIVDPRSTVRSRFLCVGLRPHGSLPTAKSLASDPLPRARPFSELPELQCGSGASVDVDAIEIAEKADRRSRNLADLILLLDKFGVTGVAQSEDRSATVAATGTHSAEDVRGTLEVPEREVLDDSQGKQVGTRDGGVSAAFDGAGDVPRYSHKLDDIVALLGLPEVCNTAPDVYGLEHAGDVGSRENSYQVGLHCLS